jgi:hypothetical protein
MSEELHWLGRRSGGTHKSDEFTSWLFLEPTILIIDDNNVTILQPNQPIRSLRTLKVCRNELESFDPKYYPELRTLYLDENQIQSLSGIRRLRLLENFSARSQRGKTSIGIQGLSELRKVYLSGILFIRTMTNVRDSNFASLGAAIL